MVATPALRRWLPPLDTALAAVLVVAAVVESLDARGVPADAARAVLGALTVASVAVRRTLPAVAATVLAAGMTVESVYAEAPDETAVLVACVLVTWSVAVHAPAREAVLGTAMVALGVSVAIATDPSDSVSNIPPTLLLFVGIPAAAGLVVRRRQREVAVLTVEKDALAHEADAAVDAERRRIARELHDVVSHAVTLVAVQAEAGQAVFDTEPERARGSLEAIGRVSREALDELHRMVALLRDDRDDRDDTDDTGGRRDPGLDDLDHLVEGVRAAGLVVVLERGGTGGSCDPAVDGCAYRVVQEALTNAVRHTADARVTVAVTVTEAEVAVDVTSHGQPHASAYGGTGRGLAGLRERVAALGGAFESGADGDAGFRVSAHLPRRPRLGAAT